MLFTGRFLIPTLYLSVDLYNLSFSFCPTQPSHQVEHITIYLHIPLTVNASLIHPLCLMSVPVSGSCSAGQKQDTFLTVSVCLCVDVRFPVSVFPRVW